MQRINVTVRLEPEKVAVLDELARSFDRDRSYLIKEAVDAYIARHRWQLEEVRKAVAEADAGEFLTDQESEVFMDELGR